jgi:hypothetical protein
VIVVINILSEHKPVTGGLETDSVIVVINILSEHKPVTGGLETDSVIVVTLFLLFDSIHSSTFQP